MTRQPALAILTLCAAVLPAVSLLASSAPQAAAEEGTPEPAPKAVAEEPDKSFGEVSKGAELTHDYVIRNQGTADLEITRVVPSCGCTVADFDRRIPPGGQGKVHVVIDTTNLVDSSRRDILVYTNDASQPILRLSFEAEVIAHLDARPGFARYQVVHGETEPGIIRQTLWAADGKEFKIVRVDSPYSYLGTEFHPASAEERNPEATGSGPQWIVEMHLDYNRAPVGPLAGEVVIHTSHEDQREVRIPVSGFVRPSMWATPHEVNLGEVKLDQPLRFAIVVQSFLTDPMEITGVDSDLAGLESSFSPIQEGRKYTVEVTLSPEMPKGAFESKLSIRTSSPISPVVEVPLRGTIL